MDYYLLLKPLLCLVNPEQAHNLAVWSLKHNLLPKQARVNLPNLQTNIWGIDFKHPLGLAAGFDKNGACISAIKNQGFAFSEVGTVTPKPQKGNPKPRLFRLAEDQAIINRMGFNNFGADAMMNQLKRHAPSIFGINIGKNKNTKDANADYLQLITKFYNSCSYIALNISSPNTAGLRELQQGDNFSGFINEVCSLRQELLKLHLKTVPIMVKIAPELTEVQLEHIVSVVLEFGLDGIIISNTTITRPELTSKYAGETGGLSGKPLFTPCNLMLEQCYRLTQGKIPLIGVGGISSGDDAYLKITLGASLIQIYTALIYQGFGVVNKITKRLSVLVEQDGYKNVSEAVGSRVKF